MNKLIVLLVLACSVCFGDIIVDHTGDGDHLTIQAAINAASNGDTVVVMQGTYIENIIITTKSITLRSTAPTNPAVVTSTIIDGNQAGSVITCKSGEYPNTVISGFVITNGSGGGMYNRYSSPTVSYCTFRGNTNSGMQNHEFASPIVNNCTFSDNTAAIGGGMYNNSSSPTVNNCTFNCNMASVGGGGMGNSHESSPMVSNCIFINNTASSGGGMDSYESSPTVKNCTFSDNTGGGFYGMLSSSIFIDCTFSRNTADVGGGIDCVDSSLAVTNCMFSDNTASYGGGLSNYGSSIVVSNCTFNCNTATYSGGGLENIYSSSTVTNCSFSGNIADIGGAMYNFHSSPSVSNCILWGNIASTSGNEIYNDGSLPVISCCDIFGCDSSGAGWDLSFGTDGGGNIDSDPLFVNVDLGNFRLQQDSPCVDQGNNDAVAAEITTDLYGYPRIVDFGCNGSATVDMGAYERPMTQLIPGDTNYDCRVDMLDLALLAENWLVGVE